MRAGMAVTGMGACSHCLMHVASHAVFVAPVDTDREGRGVSSSGWARFAVGAGYVGGLDFAIMPVAPKGLQLLCRVVVCVEPECC